MMLRSHQNTIVDNYDKSTQSHLNFLEVPSNGWKYQKKIVSRSIVETDKNELETAANFYTIERVGNCEETKQIPAAQSVISA